MTETEIKRYQLVFDKRVVSPITFMSLPYRFEEFDVEALDDDNIDILSHL